MLYIVFDFRPKLKNFKGEVDVTYKRKTYSLSTEYKLTDGSISSNMMWVSPQRTVKGEMSGTLNDKTASYDAELTWEADKTVRVLFYRIYMQNDPRSN